MHIILFKFKRFPSPVMVLVSLLCVLALMGCGGETSATNDTQTDLDGGRDPILDVGELFEDSEEDLPTDPAADAADGADDHEVTDPSRDSEDTEPDVSPNPLRVGSEETFEVATWNLHNFPSDDSTPGRVAEIIAEMEVDLWAVQEIADVAAFTELLEALPDYAGVYSFHTYGNGTYQKVAYLFRRDLLTLGDMDLLFDEDTWAFPRPPFQAEFRVEGPGGSTLELVVINLHLKANIDEDAEARRRAAIEALDEYLDGLLEETPTLNILLLGDLNDELGDPTNDNVFTAMLNEPAQYRFLTSAASDDGEVSYLPFHRLIDHLIVTEALFDECEEEHTHIIPLQTLVEGYDYEEVISDHLPVVAVIPW